MIFHSKFQSSMAIDYCMNVRMQNIPKFISFIDIDFIEISIIHDNICKLIFIRSVIRKVTNDIKWLLLATITTGSKTILTRRNSLSWKWRSVVIQLGASTVKRTALDPCSCLSESDPKLYTNFEFYEIEFINI